MTGNKSNRASNCTSKMHKLVINKTQRNANNTMNLIKLLLIMLLNQLRSYRAEIEVVDSDGSVDNGSSDAGKNVMQLYKWHLQQMLGIINETADPCMDFYAHTCGNYERLQQVAEETAAETEDVVPPLLYNKEDRMHFFFEHYDKFETRPGQILLQLYEECKTRTSQNVLNKRSNQSHWQSMRQQIGLLAQEPKLYAHWPYLKYEWQQLHANLEHKWIILAAELAAYGLPSFLNIYFAEQTIFIAPMDEGRPCVSLSELQHSLSYFLDGRNAQIAHVIGNELHYFCRTLNGEFAAPVMPNERNANITNPFIDENYKHYLTYFFTLLNFTKIELDMARKLVVNVERVVDILQVLRQTEPRIIFNYLVWYAHEQLKYEDCYLLTEEFERLLLAEYWQWHIFKPYFQRNVAMAKYLYHTTRFQKQRKQLLMTGDWYKFLLAPLGRKNFNIERLIQTHGNTYLNIENITAIFQHAHLQTNTFYANLLEVRHYLLRASFFTPLIDTEDLNHAAYFLRQFLHFCILTLKQPYFHYYATQGFNLWHDSNLLYDTDGYYTALDCLERQTLLYMKDDTISVYQWLNTNEIAAIVRFYRSFIESYKDYNFWLKGESFAFAEDLVLQYFNLNSKRILFYAVSQQYCNRNDRLYGGQINRSFMNMPIFQQAFNCTTEAPMNPSAKCIIRHCD